MGNRVSGGFVPGLVVMTLLLVGAAAWAESPAKPPSSPRSLVSPETCSADGPCPPGYWVFRAPDCRYDNLSHPAGAVLLLESGDTLQCRCRLVWLLTKKGDPPTAKVSCKWVNLDEARLLEH